MGAVFERHREPVRHDFLVAVGRLDAQLVELQELRGVGGAVVAMRQIQLELARPGDATQLRGEGVAAGRGHRGPSWRWSLVLTPTCRHSKRRGALPRQTILARRCEEWQSVLLRSRNFLAASFFTRGRRMRRVTSWSHAPWRRLGAEVVEVLRELRRL